MPTDKMVLLMGVDNRRKVYLARLDLGCQRWSDSGIIVNGVAG